ncbi:MAG: hypothetical protein WBC91_02565, partial [Phototrophicaceae bacterium]
MPTARERQKQRRNQREMARKAGRAESQAAPETNIKIPEIRIPGGQWLVIIPAAGLIFIAVVLALRFINPPDTGEQPNAIWLNKSWAYQEHSTDELVNLMNDLRDNEIGAIYLYTSSLRADGTWAGLDTGNNRFSEVQPLLETLTTQIRSVYPSVVLYAWVEVNTQTPEYRLDRPQIQNTIATFSQQMITQLDFDGVLLDVKPIFEETEDYIQLLRTVKRQIGIDTDLIVSVPPDLTPTGTELNLPNIIAPGTEWSNEYKQRVALLANQIVINAYNSYHDNPVDYIEWVTYQVDSYIEVLSTLDSNTSIIVSVPNYQSNSQAHNTEIETLEAGLDGAARSSNSLDDSTRPYFAGVAIFTDTIPNDEVWSIYQQR